MSKEKTAQDRSTALIESLREELATAKQERAMQGVKTRELVQASKALKDRAVVLLQETQRLQNALKKKEEERAEAEQQAKVYRRSHEALKGVVAQRYRDQNEHGCKWCEDCTFKVWETANACVGVNRG